MVLRLVTQFDRYFVMQMVRIPQVQWSVPLKGLLVIHNPLATSYRLHSLISNSFSVYLDNFLA